MTEGHHQSGHVMRAHTIYSLISLTIIIIMVFIIGMRIWVCNFRPLGMTETVILNKGVTLNQLAHALQKRHIVCNAFAFKLLGLASQQSRQLQAGTYQLTPSMSAYDLLQAMTLGQVKVYHLTIFPGEQWEQVASQLQSNPHLLHDLSANDQPEGLLYPDTYAFIDGTSENALLQHARSRMQAEIIKDWPARDKQLVHLHTPLQAIILASILEKEAAQYDDQRHIAGVLLNRLKHHMYLDSNATVRYGAHLTPDQLLVAINYHTDNPYNTYRHRGLPPAPIAFPDAQAIEAALHPLPTKDYYFMSTPQGQMIYSETYADQKKAIHRYGLHH